MPALPSVFVSYRRSDEPFAAAMVTSLLSDRLGGDEVFLDTLFLRQGGPFASQLLDAVSSSKVVLAILGSTWDNPANLARLNDPTDWVRRELLSAQENGVPIVPVLVNRREPPIVAALEPMFIGTQPLRVDAGDIWSLEPELTARVTDIPSSSPLVPARRRTRHDMINRATFAMLRHVLPAPQRSMNNDRMIARIVATELRDEEWLRFVATGNSPGRPNGSAVVFLTRADLGVAELGGDFKATAVERMPIAGLTAVERRDRHRLWRKVSDLRIRTATHPIVVEGMFAEEADELLEMTRLAVDNQRGFAPARQGMPWSGSCFRAGSRRDPRSEWPTATTRYA